MKLIIVVEYPDEQVLSCTAVGDVITEAYIAAQDDNIAGELAETVVSYHGSGIHISANAEDERAAVMQDSKAYNDGYDEGWQAGFDNGVENA